ncbi:LOW QUALITY PROTEIN: linoleate 9S-lipoxygenase 5, chloroplastic [Arabidopsis lyrata subsp. lyrata]|uniref:LOW QUALITY PROTEIN: linoleate 9S-lipoxygenase 5, chloroplastic n=1 Tax=Arabidopsis lyrata subsp. lyrata TaxID=81972 RepID=UPI000A29E188|nr:LOW QUALITY PROTEIN: linoleate 9S-lipoxygenase 5, chloroplastic [Arabidopsis lyrata subsp. lyrata]|eukprot:XP_020886686.1 LOW QUALITY PROTEIN: linoleate 9S-lipoxygenase 5, chloroplastic [Arabidopsis lyrata subsp. lyrata]
MIHTDITEILCVKPKTKKKTKTMEEDVKKTTMKIEGEVVVMKKNLLDFKDVMASLLDRVHELFGRRVSLHLISSHQPDPANEKRGRLGKAAHLEKWVTKLKTSVTAEETAFRVTFDWDESMGPPAAFVIKNHHHSQFYLKSLTLRGFPGGEGGPIHFVCNSWIYPSHRYRSDRVFFSNKAYLPSETPELIKELREEELQNLRGNEKEGEFKEWDRVYDYAYYNDLGAPDKGPDSARPVLGGSPELPYPRRGKTGRKPTKSDPKSESRLALLNLNIYVPRDERFSHVKFSDFLAYALKSVTQVLVPEIASVCDKTINEFDSFEDVFHLYDGSIKLANGHTISKLRDVIPWEMFRELVRNDGERFLKFPLPDVLKESRSAWRTDEEFAREMLAGLNPVVISRLQEFPPKSNLDSAKYGNQHSSIREEHIEPNMNGLNVLEALEQNKLYILDHHDALMPYLTRINSTNTKTYATRTLLLLQEDGTLKPLAIELSLPHAQGESHGSVSKVFTPAEKGVEGSVWQLAKAYAAVNDSGYHQLISHWLQTHAVIEPFIIASNRQLSVVHPIHKLLHPHFRDTMNINALARHILINSDGVLERTVFPSRYAMEMSSSIYKNWVFTDQALPKDLLKRGVAVEDPKSDNGVKLLIDDYPFAVDGLEIWSAIKTWVTEYCTFYYKNDKTVQTDTEIQSWWTELRTKGHGDKQHESWWPSMQTRDDLIETCTIIIWIASALHAAVNFGQYPYAGFLPNRPTVSRRFMPEPGTDEYAELAEDADVAFLKTITPQLQTLLGISIIEILSMHSTDEIYLGQRDSPNWTADDEPLEAFKRFGKELELIENNIIRRNNDKRFKNRTGPVNIPYTLLYPNTSDYTREGGLTGKGIPNSVSI